MTKEELYSAHEDLLSLHARTNKTLQEFYRLDWKNEETADWGEHLDLSTWYARTLRHLLPGLRHLRMWFEAGSADIKAKRRQIEERRLCDFERRHFFYGGGLFNWDGKLIKLGVEY